MNNENQINQEQIEEVSIQDAELEAIALAFCVRTGVRAGVHAGITPCV